MFSNILKKLKTEDKKGGNKELVSLIQKMNLTEMRNYVNDKTVGFNVSEEGLIAILNKLMFKNKGRYYINEDDNNTKIRKSFELVLFILTNKKATHNVVELVVEFVDIFRDLIEKYDKDNKDIYSSKFINTIAKAVAKIDYKTNEETKIDIVNNI
jgi:hypothetical protein